MKQVNDNKVMEKAARNTISDTLKNSASMEGKQEKAKTAYSIAMDEAEARAMSAYNEAYFFQAQFYMAMCIQSSLLEQERIERERGNNSEANKLHSMAMEGAKETNYYRVRFSSVENGTKIDEIPAITFADMFKAAKQSTLKIQLKKREEKAAMEAEAERKAAEEKAAMEAAHKAEIEAAKAEAKAEAEAENAKLLAMIEAMKKEMEAMKKGGKKNK